MALEYDLVLVPEPAQEVKFGALFRKTELIVEDFVLEEIGFKENTDLVSTESHEMLTPLNSMDHAPLAWITVRI
jgi:signal transduction histidine kinase